MRGTKIDWPKRLDRKHNAMTSKYEEISTNLVSVVLEMVDITEKFNKMGTKEVEAMIVSALNGSKRINSTMKKILEIDSLVY